jgi:acetyl-CoA C-acetyltransferase
MPKTVILGTARTPVGKLGGGLSSLKATELGGIAIEAALQRAAGCRAAATPSSRAGTRG